MANITNENLNNLNLPRVAQGKLESLANQIEQKVSARTSQLMKKSSDYVESSRHYVKDNPIKSVAFAAAFGAALGVVGAAYLRR